MVIACAISVDPQKVRGVRDWSVPSNVKVSWICRMAQQYFSTIAAPLNALNGKNREFVWDESCDASFNMFKVRLAIVPLLAIPNDKNPYILDTGASA